MRPPYDPLHDTIVDGTLGHNNAKDELGEAMVMVGNKQCGRVPIDPPQGRWFKITCYGDGVTGNIINIVKTKKSSLSICGIHVVGVKDAVSEIYDLEKYYEQEKEAIKSLNNFKS